MDWIQLHWLEIVGVLYLAEKFLTAFSELTPWKWDDNVAKIFANLVKVFLPKRAE